MKTNEEAISQYTEDRNDDELINRAAPKESLDNLILSGYKIYQRDDQFKFSMDAIMLAHFIPIKARATYVELGAGTGVIPHVLIHRGAQSIIGIERNGVMVDLARRSIAYNSLEERIHIIGGDFTMDAVQLEAREILAKSSVDELAKLSVHQLPKFSIAFMNPPYFASGTGKTSKETGIREALHEGDASFDEYIQAAKALVVDTGYVYLIHRSDRLEDIFYSLHYHKFGVKRLRFVHGTRSKPSKLVLIEAKGGAKTGMIVEAPLIMYDDNGQYTEEVKGWYARET